VARSSDNVTTPSVGCLPRRVKSSGCKLSDSNAVRFSLRRFGEIVQESVSDLPWVSCNCAKRSKGSKRPGFAVLQNDPQPRHPVGALPDDQMADDVERAPGIFAFVAARPDVGSPRNIASRVAGVRVRTAMASVRSNSVKLDSSLFMVDLFVFFLRFSGQCFFDRLTGEHLVAHWRRRRRSRRRLRKSVSDRRVAGGRRHPCSSDGCGFRNSIGS